MIKRILFLVLLGAVIWAAVKYRPLYQHRILRMFPPARQEAESPLAHPGIAEESFRCYFPGTEGLEPVEEIRRRPSAADPLERLRGILDELHNGPESPGALSLFPSGATLRSLFLAADGTAYLDYPSRALELAPGPREEFLFMRCLARTFLRNCPEVKAFVIMVDGNARHRLMLHFPAHGKYLLPRS